MQHEVLRGGLAATLVFAVGVDAQSPPVSGPAFSVAMGSDGAVTYDPRSGLYFAAFSQPGYFVASAATGRFFSADGTRRGLLDLSNSRYSVVGPPRVAAIQGQDHVLAAYPGRIYYGSYVLLATTNPAGGVRGPTALDGVTDVLSVDVGGEAGAAYTGALVVVDVDATFGDVIRVYDVDTERLRSVASLDLTTAATSDFDPKLPASGGQAGRYLVTWRRYNPATGSDIYGAIVDRDLRVLVAELPIASTVAQERDAEVDGDGVHWVVAYVTSNPPISGATDVVCRTVTYNATTGTAHVGAQRRVAAQPGVNESEPAVAWLGESFLVGFGRQSSRGDWDVFASSVDAIGCGPCEGEFLIAAEPQSESAIQLASHRSSGGVGDEAVALWWQYQGPYLTAPLTSARPFRAADGAVRELGGGCGTGGHAVASCAAVGATTFGLGLRQAAPLAPAWLVLGATAAPFPCGRCALVPAPLIAVPFSTDERGDASFVAALSEPSLVGQSLFTQWLVAATAPGGCPSARMSLSNALDVTVE
ncbi:MAG: hypothetical protein AAF628_34370 [Planctomycetota bacterium]